MRPVTMRFKRSDGEEFTLDNISWMIPNDGLENWGNVIPEVSSMDTAGYDGGIITHKRVGMIDRSVHAEYIGTNFAAAHRTAVRFFNPKFSYKVYLTYQGRTLWAEGELYKYEIATGNIYAKPTIDVTILFSMPYLLSVNNFGKDIAGITPHFGFPLYSYVWKDIPFQEVEAHAPKAMLWNTPLPNSDAITKMMNLHRTVTFDGDLTLFRFQPQGIPNPNNCSVFLHNQSTGEMYKLMQLEDTSWTNAPKVFNVTVDVNKVIADQLATAHGIDHNTALHRAGELDLTQFTLKAFGWQASANGRPQVADAEFVMRASVGSLDGGNPYPEVYPRGFITGVYDFGKKLDIDNDGDVFTFPRVVMKASGDVVNPSINLDDRFVKVLTTLHEGDELDINFDHRPPTVTINGNNSIHLVDKMSTFTNFQIDLGHNIFTYDADSGSNVMSVSLFWYKRYLGL